jgi:hypothetical protein
MKEGAKLTGELDRPRDLSGLLDLLTAAREVEFLCGKYLFFNRVVVSESFVRDPVVGCKAILGVDSGTEDRSRF